MHTFVSNKSFDQLLDVLPRSVIFLKMFGSEFPYVEVWFTEQNYKPLEIGNKIIFSYWLKFKIKTLQIWNLQIWNQVFLKGYVFFSFAKNIDKILVKIWVKT